MLPMERRPQLKIKLTPVDKVIEFIGLFALVLMWGMALYYFFTLPIRFDASGQPNDYGQKATIFILPVIGLCIYTLLTLLNKYPHIFNYPTNITAANALQQYTNATKLIRYLKTIIVVIFTLIVLFTCLTATDRRNGLGVWFLPAILALLFIPNVYFIAKSFKASKG
jgi:uncharacterized membrane protein